ncbi:hypothetical protein GCM10011409_41470 [Lentibacillus populi]|uniref:Thioredoxin-like fold domain-containing protein n=2 Tax=Bacillaceae TaxID=186817 RepID=A0A9W5U1T7_9BACI|nr:thioredoxin family protein [Lentibacillus populi]MBT2217703.1 thioredoxin family protein [Virgibacillus dakarensis]GGB59772.1 hypothetical protein GCM10011409_41470 [Lentibacillus populi]
MHLLLFTASTCPKCTIVKNFMQQQRIQPEVVSADKNRVLADRFQVFSVPTTILLTDDKTEIARSTGVNPNELLNMFQQFQGGTI